MYTDVDGISLSLSSSDAYMLLGDSRIIPNHGLVFYSDIGTTDITGLRCVTRRVDCCEGATDGDITEWFNPNGDSAGPADDSFNMNRRGEGEEFGYVNLWRQDAGSTLVTEGIYSCIIPESGSDPNPDIATLFVGIYNTGGGECPCITCHGLHHCYYLSCILFLGTLSINDPVQFTLDSANPPVFTLTCTSTGGPATTVTWTLGGSLAGGTESQIVTNMRSATYSNTLTVTGRHTGDYQCSVDNARTASPVTQTLTVTGE